MPFEPIAEDDPFTEDDWLEAVSRVKVGPDTFTNRRGQATIPVYVENPTQGKLRSALTYILGYSFADDGTSPTPYALHRPPAVAHPIWGFAYRCTGADISLATPKGNPDNGGNEPYETSDVTPEGIARFATYGACFVNAHFEPVDYYAYEDDDPDFDGNEWNRYVTINRKTTLDVLQSDSGTMTFAEGPPNGRPYNAPIAEYVPKTIITLKWLSVAMSYTHDANGVPKKLDALIGTTNDDEFMGYPAGSLLFYPPEYEKFQFPFFSEDGRAFYHDIQLNLGYFDPKPGTGATSGKRGWKLLPWRGGGGEGGGPGWYWAIRPDGSDYLPDGDFKTAFEHVNL